MVIALTWVEAGAGVAIAVVSSAGAAVISHYLSRVRDVAQRRYQLRVDLYSELIELIVTNEELHAQRSGNDHSTADIEIQKRRIEARHRLQLVATDETIAAYDKYNRLLRTETEEPRDQWPEDPSAVYDARNALISAMRSELRRWRKA